MAGEINIARYDNNEILHKDDLQYGETREYENLTSLLERIAVSTNDPIIEGGIVKERGTPSMNVDIEATLAFCVSAGKLAYFGSDFGPVAITNGGAQNRIDTLEIRVKETNFDELQRAFKDPNTGDVTYQNWMTKIHYEIEAQVIQGTEGAGVAPNHTSGWIKIAEIDVDAGESTSILDADIHNVTAGYDTETNSGWTAETAITFRSKALTEIKTILRAKHKEDGDHEDDVIRDQHIDFGAGAGEVDADLMPLGTTITHAPTGGTAANLTSTSTVRQAVQKILDLLIDLSGVQDDALDSRHIAAGAIDNEHIGDDQVDSEHYAPDSIDDEHINFGTVAGQVDADLLPLGTAITHAPTGGTAAGLTSSSTVRQAVQKILDLLIDLSGVENDAIDSRHIGDDQILNQHIADDQIDSEHYVDDSIDDEHINFGTGAGQISAVDLPIADAGTLFPIDNVEAALQEAGAFSFKKVVASYASLPSSGMKDGDLYMTLDELEIFMWLDDWGGFWFPYTEMIHGIAAVRGTTGDWDANLTWKNIGKAEVEPGSMATVVIRGSATGVNLDANEAFGIMIMIGGYFTATLGSTNFQVNDSAYNFSVNASSFGKADINWILAGQQSAGSHRRIVGRFPGLTDLNSGSYTFTMIGDVWFGPNGGSVNEDLLQVSGGTLDTNGNKLTFEGDATNRQDVHWDSGTLINTSGELDFRSGIDIYSNQTTLGDVRTTDQSGNTYVMQQTNVTVEDLYLDANTTWNRNGFTLTVNGTQSGPGTLI